MSTNQGSEGRSGQVRAGTTIADSVYARSNGNTCPDLPWPVPPALPTTHGCPGDPCQVCQLDHIIARSPIPQPAVINALRDHNRRIAATFWADLTTGGGE